MLNYHAASDRLPRVMIFCEVSTTLADHQANRVTLLQIIFCILFQVTICLNVNAFWHSFRVFSIHVEWVIMSMSFLSRYICYAQSVKLPISRNRQAYCPVCEIGTVSAHFANWPISLPISWNGQHHVWNFYARMYVNILNVLCTRWVI